MHSKRGFPSRAGTGISPKPSSNRICRFPFLLFRQRIDIRTSVLPSPEGETNITPGEEHAVRRNPGYRPTPRSAPGGRHCGRSSKCGCQCISKCEAHRNLKSSSKPDNHKPNQPPSPRKRTTIHTSILLHHRQRIVIRTPVHSSLHSFWITSTCF